MFDLLLTYWPVLLLLYVPKLAQLVAGVIAKRTQGKLDHRIPDDLPMSAGEWLDGRLRAMRIGVTAVVTDKHEDAYRPYDKLIQLHDTTHFKADPVYWATAAHELGHARNRVVLPALGHLRAACNAYTFPLLMLGVACLAGHVLYALPLAGRIAFACFAVASALRVFVLVDEAAASIYAYRELRANDAIDFTHLRAIRAVLITAFATYLATYASYALLLTQWSLLATLAHPIARFELTTLGWIMVTVLSVASAASFAVRDGALRWVPIMLLVLLVWNVIDPAYSWCVIAALAASWHVWRGMAHVPFLIPFLFVTIAAQKLEGPGVDRTTRFMRLRERGAKAVARGNAQIDALQARWTAHPTLIYRIWRLARFGYLPLLVAIWL